MILSQRGESTEGAVSYAIELNPRETWELQLDIVPLVDGQEISPRLIERRFGDELVHVRDSLAAWQLRIPQLRAEWDDLQHAFAQSVSDLAVAPHPQQLGRRARPPAGRRLSVVHDRLRTRHDHHVPADAALRAGARPAARSRCSPSSRRARTTRRSTPSPARSCTRSAPARPRRSGSPPTTARSTRRRSTSSCSRRSGAGRATWRSSAASRSRRCRALEWIDEHGDRDGDGFVEYERRTPRGLENQSWKDSYDSQRFSDGRFAEDPDRALRGAGLRLRREVPHERARARRLARP